MKKHAVYMTYYIEKLHTVYLKLYKRWRLKQHSYRKETALHIKMFINYKREIYALAHLNLSTASFKCLS